MATINGSAIHKVVVACDAGMGSSVMLASQLRRQLGKHVVAGFRRHVETNQPLQLAVVFIGIGAEPNRPEGVGGNLADGSILVVQAGREGKINIYCAEKAKSENGGAARLSV